MHMSAKKSNKSRDGEGASVIMTKIFAPIPYASPVRNPRQELALLLDQETRQILDYSQYQAVGEGGAIANSYKLNKNHVDLKKQARQYELRSDVIDSEIAICSKSIFTHLEADFAMQTLKEEFILQLNTSEITDDMTQAYILPPNYYFGEVSDPRTYAVITQDIIARKCYPFVVDFPVFHATPQFHRMVYSETPFNKYVAVNVKRHLTSRISDSTVIGDNSVVGENSTVEQSVIGANCKIGKNVTIRRSIIWDNTEIHDNCTVDDSLICDNVVVNANCVVEPGTRLDKNV